MEMFHLLKIRTSIDILKMKSVKLLLAFNIYCIMWRSNQPRFHPDLNRGLYRERVGVVLSAHIRSYHVLMSILTIGLIVEKFLAAKKFIPINTVASTIGTIASDRMTS